MRNAIPAIAVVLGAIGTIAACSDPESYRDCPECPLMVVVPGGSFMMGSTLEEANPESHVEIYNSELPRHSVSVKQFSLGVTEVTVDQFGMFARATGRSADGRCLGGSIWDFPQTGNHPAICVNRSDAEAYARWLSSKTGKDYRLPTEAEWEYAARAGTTTSRFWGDSPNAACRFANVKDATYAGSKYLSPDDEMFQCTDGYAATAPVGKFQANAFGLHDMMGNVEEWTADCSNSSYKGAPTDGAAWLSGDCFPYGVVRGGSWLSNPWKVRSADRNWVAATNGIADVGFRAARTN